MINLMHGDCLELMRDIPDVSVDMILCDPPYGTMKGIGSAHVKHGMVGKTEWDDALDPALFLKECNRLLRMNGALVLSSQEPYTSRLITEAHGNLPFSYRMVWLKDHFANALSAKKAPLSYFEDILVFAKRHTKHDFEGFHPLRSYASSVLGFIGKSRSRINADMGHRRAEHFFYVDTTQFSLCTAVVYDDLTCRYGLRTMVGYREFEDLAEEDRKYREGLIAKMTAQFPKTFNLPEGKKYKSNVLQYKKDYDGYHPTQKPVALMEDLIRTYTNEGDTVLDFTMGSGTTGVACKNLNRKFIGIEKDDKYFEIAKNRIENHIATLL